MQKILVLSLSLQPPGGGNGVGAWTVQALCCDYEVTVLTWESFSPASVDRYFGTSLQEARLRAISAPLWLQWLILAIPVQPLVHFQMNYVLGMLRRRAHQFDLLICTH